jgi:hypothetical protein
MFGLFSFLMFVLSAVSLATFIWLVVVAFKNHVGWGLAVLFIPFAAIVFAIMNWDEAKKPFLGYLASTVGFFVVFIAMAGSMFGMAAQMAMEMEDMDPEEAARYMQQQMDDAGMLSAEDRDEFEKMFQQMAEEADRAGSGTAMSFQETPVSSSTQSRPDPDPEPVLDPASAERQRALALAAKQFWSKDAGRQGRGRPLSGHQSISVNDAGKYIGEVMRVTGRDGLNALGTLEDVSDDSLLFERRMSGGTALFHVAKRDIKSLQIVYR